MGIVRSGDAPSPGEYALSARGQPTKLWVFGAEVYLATVPPSTPARGYVPAAARQRRMPWVMRSRTSACSSSVKVCLFKRGSTRGSTTSLSATHRASATGAWSATNSRTSSLRLASVATAASSVGWSGAVVPLVSQAVSVGPPPARPTVAAPAAATQPSGPARSRSRRCRYGVTSEHPDAFRRWPRV